MLKLNKTLLVLCIFILSACTSYKYQTSVPNDVFLSHGIFKKNYRKYVYLVHDKDSSYLLHNVTAKHSWQSDTVEKLSGVLETIPTLVDTTNYYESYVYLNTKENIINIYLTKDQNRKVELHDTLILHESDIQKVRLHNSMNQPIKNKVFEGFKLFLLFGFTVFTLIVTIVIVTWN